MLIFFGNVSNPNSSYTRYLIFKVQQNEYDDRPESFMNSESTISCKFSSAIGMHDKSNKNRMYINVLGRQLLCNIEIYSCTDI